MLIFLIVIVTACSSNSNSEGAKMSADNSAGMDKSSSQEQSAISGETTKTEQTEQTKKAPLEVPNQMVIYQADLQMRVKKFEQTLQHLEEAVIKFGGYIASSNIVREGDEQVSGNITIRIPQKHFQAFLSDAEGQAAEVLQRNITGTDVTEEYVDLESRLKSKKVVEERLISFMNAAVKTEDLLKISNDLAAVQEEIETIQGRMKYLENQTSLSTINITLFENKVVVPNLEDEDLNTWEKTKKQFMKSLNFLMSAFSGFMVFIFGNLPIFLILAIIALIIYLIAKRVTKNRGDH